VPRIGDNARRGLRLPGRLAVDAAGWGLGTLLAGIAAARGGKAVHPSGVAYGARLVVDGSPQAPRGSQLLATPGTHSALMRFSRSLGMPRPIPDLLGVSVRVLDVYGPGRHQDFMLVSSVDQAVLHHIFVPAADAQQRPYSSSLPYQAGDETFLVGVVPDAQSPRPSGDDEFHRLQRAAATGRLTFGLAVASVGGRFGRVGTLHVEERLPQSSRGRERPCGHRESFLRGRGWRRKILTTFLPASTGCASARFTAAAGLLPAECSTGCATMPTRCRRRRGRAAVTGRRRNGWPKRSCGRSLATVRSKPPRSRG